jgi:hypothetical protein
LWVLLAALLIAVLGGTWQLMSSFLSTPTRPAPTKNLNPVLSTSRDHLLIYAFSYSDPEYLQNLQYFIAEAVVNDTVADHVIIVQEGPTLKVLDVIHSRGCTAGMGCDTAAAAAFVQVPVLPLTGAKPSHAYMLLVLQLVEHGPPLLSTVTGMSAGCALCRKPTYLSFHHMQRTFAIRMSAMTGGPMVGSCFRQAWSTLPSTAISFL